MSEPSPSQIREWRERWGEVFVASELDDDDQLQTYYFRGMGYEDFQMLSETAETSFEMEDQILSECILWPENVYLDDISPGLASNIAEVVTKESTFVDVYSIIDLLNRYREEANEIDGQIVSFILAAFPAMHLNEVKNLSASRMLSTLALAEKTLQIKQMVNGFSPGEDITPIQLVILTPEDQEAMARQRISKEGNATVSDPIAQKLHGSGLI